MRSGRRLRDVVRVRRLEREVLAIGQLRRAAVRLVRRGHHDRSTPRQLAERLQQRVGAADVRLPGRERRAVRPPTLVCAPRWKTVARVVLVRAPAASASCRQEPRRDAAVADAVGTNREPTRSDRLSTTTSSPRASRRSTSAQPIRPCAPVTKELSAAGHGREDRDLVAVLDRRVEPVQEADVLAAHVHVHEAAQVAVLRDPVAQAVVAVVEPVEDLADRGRAVDRGLRLAAVTLRSWVGILTVTAIGDRADYTAPTASPASAVSNESTVGSIS